MQELFLNFDENNFCIIRLCRNYIRASTKHYILWRAQIIIIPALLFVILNNFCTVSNLKWIIVCGVWRLMIRIFIILAHLILRCARIMTIRAVLFVWHQYISSISIVATVSIIVHCHNVNNVGASWFAVCQNYENSCMTFWLFNIRCASINEIQALLFGCRNAKGSGFRV